MDESHTKPRRTRRGWEHGLPSSASWLRVRKFLRVAAQDNPCLRGGSDKRMETGEFCGSKSPTHLPNKRAAQQRGPFVRSQSLMNPGDPSPRRRNHAVNPEACHVPKIWDTAAGRDGASKPLIDFGCWILNFELKIFFVGALVRTRGIGGRRSKQTTD